MCHGNVCPYWFHTGLKKMSMSTFRWNLVQKKWYDKTLSILHFSSLLELKMRVLPLKFCKVPHWEWILGNEARYEPGPRQGISQIALKSSPAWSLRPHRFTLRGQISWNYLSDRTDSLEWILCWSSNATCDWGQNIRLVSENTLSFIIFTF